MSNETITRTITFYPQQNAFTITPAGQYDVTNEFRWKFRDTTDFYITWPGDLYATQLRFSYVGDSSGGHRKHPVEKRNNEDIKSTQATQNWVPIIKNCKIEFDKNPNHVSGTHWKMDFGYSTDPNAQAPDTWIDPEFEVGSGTQAT